MIPFYSRFPDLAAQETRCVHVLDPGGSLPIGEYGFVEFYCNDPACDCRRVLLQVTTPKEPETVLATINYGWEHVDFYTRWMHGDPEAGNEITEASLDPLNPQSKYADHLLDIFRNLVKNDPAYVERLARHYEMFKGTQHAKAEPSVDGPPHSGAGVPPAREERDDSSALTGLQSTTPMTVPEILEQLRTLPDQTEFAPYERALLAAAEQREAITPELIAAIDRVSAAPAKYLEEDNEDWLHLFALCLLAQFHETRALDAFIRFFSLPGEQSLDLSGDLVTERGASILASVCGGDPAPLLNLIHDESVNEFVRSEALRGLAVQSVWRERPREAVVEDLRRLFQTLAQPGDPYLWAELVRLICEFHAPELAADARAAFAEGLVDEDVRNEDDLEEDLSRGEELLADFREQYEPVNAVNECSGWVCFRDDDESLGPWEDDDLDLEDPPDDIFGSPPEAWADLPAPTPYIPPPTPTPYVAPAKAGRNDPCPCGSGKKYKKCCGK